MLQSLAPLSSLLPLLLLLLPPAFASPLPFLLPLPWAHPRGTPAVDLAGTPSLSLYVKQSKARLPRHPMHGCPAHVTLMKHLPGYSTAPAKQCNWRAKVSVAQVEPASRGRSRRDEMCQQRMSGNEGEE